MRSEEEKSDRDKGKSKWKGKEEAKHTWTFFVAMAVVIVLGTFVGIGVMPAENGSQRMNASEVSQNEMYAGGAVESVGPSKMEDIYIKLDNYGGDIYKIEVTDIYRTLYDNTSKVRFTGHINLTWGSGGGIEAETLKLWSCLVVDNGLDNGFDTNFTLTVNGGDPGYSGITSHVSAGQLFMRYSGMSVDEAFLETGILGNEHYGGEALLRWDMIEHGTNFEKDFDFTIGAQDVTGIRRMFGGLQITTNHFESLAIASTFMTYANAS